MPMPDRRDTDPARDLEHHDRQRDRDAQPAFENRSSSELAGSLYARRCRGTPRRRTAGGERRRTSLRHRLRRGRRAGRSRSSMSRPGCTCAAMSSAASSSGGSTVGSPTSATNRAVGSTGQRYSDARRPQADGAPVHCTHGRPADRRLARSSDREPHPARSALDAEAGVDRRVARDQRAPVDDARDPRAASRPRAELAVPQPRRARAGRCRAPRRHPRRVRPLRAGRSPERAPSPSRVLALRPRRGRAPRHRASNDRSPRRWPAPPRPPASASTITGSTSSASAGAARRRGERSIGRLVRRLAARPRCGREVRREVARVTGLELGTLPVGAGDEPAAARRPALADELVVVVGVAHRVVEADLLAHARCRSSPRRARCRAMPAFGSHEWFT